MRELCHLLLTKGVNLYILYIYKHINIKFYVYSWKSSRPNKEWGFRMIHGSRGFPILPMGFRRLVQMDFLVEKLHMDEEQWSPSISRFHTKDHLILCKTMYILHRENIGSNWFLPFKKDKIWWNRMLFLLPPNPYTLPKTNLSPDPLLTCPMFFKGMLVCKQKSKDFSVAP